MEITVQHLDELADAAQKIIAHTSQKRVFAFYGSMGAGKTTLIKELVHALGVQEHTSSPTFSIVNEYASPQGPVYHFDFYRLKDEQEAFDMGYEEYLYSGHYCFIEWPERIENLLPTDCQHIEIVAVSPTERHIKLF